jgi:uncharacterized membrane-anchored protein YitT (DUF2179 family)
MNGSGPGGSPGHAQASGLCHPQEKEERPSREKSGLKSFVKQTISLLLIALGILSAGLGLKGFLLPSHFIDGGITGVSMLIAALSRIQLPVLILIINAPFIVIGYLQIGGVFALKSAVAIGGLSAYLAFVPCPTATEDKLLAAVFGGFFLGAGIGLSIRGGGVLDGTEILALILSKKVGTTVGDVILALNILIFSVAAIFLGLEPALYSVLTYFSASRTIDFLMHGIEQYNGVMIVSARSEEIKQAILNDLGRGVTVFRGQGGLTEVEQKVLFCVLTRLELPKVKQIVAGIDESAFIAIHHVTDVEGGVIRKRMVH